MWIGDGGGGSSDQTSHVCIWDCVCGGGGEGSSDQTGLVWIGGGGGVVIRLVLCG